MEAAGIPYTFVAANCCGAYFINILLRPQAQPRDITVYGDGQAKGKYHLHMPHWLLWQENFFSILEVVSNDVV